MSKGIVIGVIQMLSSEVWCGVGGGIETGNRLRMRLDRECMYG